MTWRVQSADLFPNGPIDLAHAVVEEQCWVAIASASVSSGVTHTIQTSPFSQCRSYKQTHPGGKHGERDIQQHASRNSLWKRSPKRKCIVSLPWFVFGGPKIS